MPAANHVVLASGAAVAVSVAVATAIALYESPELRRYADDVRRRIAVALHAMGEGIDPPHREPLFNRPEDVNGFLQSRSGEGAEPGVDADEETRRRQREELLYWNSVRLQEEEAKEKGGAHGDAEDEKRLVWDEKTEIESSASSTKRLTQHARGTSFDDFMHQDKGAERGAFVFNTGADVRAAGDEGLRRRGEAPRGLAASMLSNPFADEHFIVSDDIETAQASQLAPAQDEAVSDIYSSTTLEHEQPPSPPSPPVELPEPSLIDLNQEVVAPTETSATLDRSPEPEEYMTPGQEDRQASYASIQAWAQGSQQGFYSPLPSTPAVSDSEPEFLSDGQLTPTDSVSVIGSAESVGNDAAVSRNGDGPRPFDVMSESDGMMTPASWSEVGSVISESDAPAPVRA